MVFYAGVGNLWRNEVVRWSNTGVGIGHCPRFQEQVELGVYPGQDTSHVGTKAALDSGLGTDRAGNQPVSVSGQGTSHVGSQASLVGGQGIGRVGNRTALVGGPGSGSVGN